MKSLYFTCGPSQLYPTVPKHIKNALKLDIPQISHRGKKFQEIFFTAQNNLRKLMNIPKENHIFFLSSSLESMERIVENCVWKSSFHLINGAFAEKFFNMSLGLGKKAYFYKEQDGESIDFGKIQININAEVICLTQNETSTGVFIPTKYINTMARRYPDKLMVLDIVSSAPYPKIDFSQVDIAFFSVQKGFGIPAGLGVMIINPKALDKSDFIFKRNKQSTYHSFFALAEKEKRSNS